MAPPVLVQDQSAAAARHSPSAPETGPLGKNANSYGTASRPTANDRRRGLWDAQRLLWEHSTLERVRKCRRVPTSSNVVLGRMEDGSARYANLTTCASIHCCPRCASRIWAGRGEELAAALEAWHLRGYAVGFITLTMRHAKSQGLADLWDGLSSAWASASTQNAAIRKARERLNVKGFARVVESTYGANGWHTHLHVVAFFERPPKDLEPAVIELGNTMFDGWEKRLRGLGFAAPLRDSGGLDVQVVNLDQAHEKVAGYVTKGTFEKAAFEVTGGTTKDARGGNRTPWGLLRAGAEGDRESLSRWHEWEQASAGRRAMTWTQGLRKELLPDMPEQDDDDLADEERGELVPVAFIDKSDWAKVCRIRHAPARLLEAAEAASDPLDAWLEVRALMSLWNLPPPGLPVGLPPP